MTSCRYVQRLVLFFLFALLCSRVSAQPRQEVLTAAVSGRLEQVVRMLDAAKQGDANALWDAKTEIEELPYPARGDRKSARKLNITALDKFKAEQIGAALADFEQAWRADPSDQEIANNYGYVLYRSNRLSESERLLRYTLALAPARATAWANLGEVLGAQGQAQGAAAAFVVSHRFSRNPDTTRQYIEKFAAGADTPALKAGAEMALAKLFPAAVAGPSASASVAPLAGTAGERRAIDANELAAAGSKSAVAAGPASRAPGEAPVALANPMQRLVDALPGGGEVMPLYIAALQGSTEARETLLRMGHAGNPRAQNAVGNLFAQGRGVEANTELANTWYRKAASQGFVLAQFSLAWNQYHGIGMAVDYPQAIDGYRRAAEQGHPVAMNNLGVMHARGQGTPSDAKAAFDWFNRAAESGLARGAFNAGVMLERGIGVPADARRAFALQLSAAQVGFAQSQLKVAQAYEYGWAGTQDKALAIDWYKKAALLGLEPARDALKRLGVSDY
nr:tetratricopeptide repeat protein [uncultured Roseateles sp.]